MSSTAWHLAALAAIALVSAHVKSEYVTYRVNEGETRFQDVIPTMTEPFGVSMKLMGAYATANGTSDSFSVAIGKSIDTWAATPIKGVKMYTGVSGYDAFCSLPTNVYTNPSDAVDVSWRVSDSGTVEDMSRSTGYHFAIGLRADGTYIKFVDGEDEGSYTAGLLTDEWTMPYIVLHDFGVKPSLDGRGQIDSYLSVLPSVMGDTCRICDKYGKPIDGAVCTLTNRVVDGVTGTVYRMEFSNASSVYVATNGYSDVSFTNHLEYVEVVHTNMVLNLVCADHFAETNGLGLFVTPYMKATAAGSGFANGSLHFIFEK